jgi:hypothetical protein
MKKLNKNAQCEVKGYLSSVCFWKYLTGMQNIIWMAEPFMEVFCMFAMLLRWNHWQKLEPS